MAILEGSSSVTTNGKEKFKPSSIFFSGFPHRISQDNHLHCGFARRVQADQGRQNFLILLFHQGFNVWQLKTDFFFLLTLKIAFPQLWGEERGEGSGVGTSSLGQEKAMRPNAVP